MKSQSLAFILTSCVVSAAAPALPSFSEKLSTPPRLSLSAAVKSGQLPPVDEETKATLEWIRSAAPKESRYVSRMPVIAPDQSVDRNMPVVVPKADTDFKAIVKEPSVDSAK